MFTQEHLASEKKYLELLSQGYPTIQSASTEIINLSAILNLPKGTEHFISDIHGEYEVFTHIIKNASGSIKRKINSCFGSTISMADKDELATIIYYPEEKISQRKTLGQADHDWYRIILVRLVMVCRVATSKYTRSKVRKCLSSDFRYIIDELMYTDNFEVNKQEYFDNILNTIIDINRADQFICELASLLQTTIVDKLHIIGDIFDRGSGAHLIMDDLVNHHNVDIQWGNHDIVWMGASLGHRACIANVIRNSIRYNNFDSLEDGYGINIRPLAIFAMEQYRDDPCTFFKPKVGDEISLDKFEENTIDLAGKVHKAITIIQLKLEGQIIANHPEFAMESRQQLGTINWTDGTISIDGVTHQINDLNLPTVDKENPYTLTDAELMVMEQLELSFKHSHRLKNHVNFLFKKGSMYRVYNDNLMYHGCVPMTESGEFASLTLNGVSYSGKALLDQCDKICRIGAFGSGEQKTFGLDFMWYLWCGPLSPLNGKQKMTTFERAFINDQTTWDEVKDPYYSHVEQKEIAEKILELFDTNNQSSHIVNGHVPVKIKKGESPIKADGKLLIIDGGISKAYLHVTGISGYTLISNSYQLLISEHQPFTGVASVIANNDDMHSKNILVENYPTRITIANTDKGREIQRKITDLKMLLESYRTGIIKQQG